MATATNALFASTRRARSLGLLVAGGIFFVIGIGGSGALWGAYSGPVAVAVQNGIVAGG